MAIYYSSLSVVTDVVRLPLHTMLAVSDIVIADHTDTLLVWLSVDDGNL